MNRILCFLLLTTCSAHICLAAEPSAEQINAIFSSVTSNAEPGLAVVVRKDGRTAFERGYGMRDLRSSLPVDVHTNFRLASFSKQFTATAIMLLVHDGKLRYDERITDIFPEFPAYGKEITVRTLLNHTSGLHDYEDLMMKKYSGQPWQSIPQIDDEGVLDLLEQESDTKFPPGSKWEYCNGGYEVLANVVRKVSGQPFRDFLRDRIFIPLRMNSTIVYQYGKNQIADRAYGYTNDNGVWLETDQSPTSATLGDGAVYSSVDDLIKWDDALRSHTLLSAEEFRPAVMPVQMPENTGISAGTHPGYGFGWFLDAYNGQPRMWHTGGTIGFQTVIERFPEQELTIVVLANRTDVNPKRLADKVADLYFPRQTSTTGAGSATR
ncbi:MAG TPA: serine hydrolase domain-containing protein [Terriglobales bacterium]|nr:serine hydrolase domain-containing protein [Terriglobales bacterium]HXF12146.1 serine hydrolase domain-containing protein [Terriglobales bacterium]